MSHRAINLQDAFLNQVREEGIPVIVALTTEELRGEVRCFDNFTIVLTVHGVESLVYKHAVGEQHRTGAKPPPGRLDGARSLSKGEIGYIRC